MSMAFEDLHEGILAEFAERAEFFEEAVRFDTVFPQADDGEFHDRPRIRLGMHVINDPRLHPQLGRHRRRTDADKEYDRARATLYTHNKIRERLLAGERPKSRNFPARWVRVAQELGIDLGIPAPKDAA